MTTIVRMQKFSPWLPAEPGWSSDELRIAVQVEGEPTEVVCSGRGLSPVRLKSKKRGGQMWWTAEVPVDLLVGTVRLIIDVNGGLTEFTTDIVPAGVIFEDGQSAVERLVAALVEAHRHLPWGDGPAYTPVELEIDERSIPDPTPLGLHVMALDRSLGQLKRRLAAIAQSPVHVVRSARELRPLDRVRRLDPASAARAARSPSLLSALRGESAPTPGQRLDVLVAGSEPHPVHCQIRSAAIGLIHRLVDNAACAERYADEQRAKKQWQPAKVAEELRGRFTAYAKDLRVALRTPFWRSVPAASDGAPPPAAMQVIADHPDYSAAWRLIRTLAYPLARLDAAGMVDGVLRPGFDLWEQYVWCRVCRVIADTLGPGWASLGWRAHRQGLVVGPGDNAFVETTRGPLKIRVGSQIVFPSASRHYADRGEDTEDAVWSRGRFSLNLTRQPDVVIELYAENELVEWGLLDAKFAATCFPIEAKHLPAMHTYRDGLRLDDCPPSFAFIVVPALADEAECYSSNRFRTKFNIGALVDNSLVADGHDDRAYEPVADWILSWIETASST